MYMSFKEIIAEQKKPLDHKVEAAIRAIQDGYDICRSKAAFAFSGGKDSTVLLHIAKTHFPEQFAQSAIIFGNTGVEYPESLSFARELGKSWGGENFYEARPAALEKDGLKYAAQRQVLEWLIETGKIASVLKADGKLKSTDALERACPSEMRERFERENLIWRAGTVKSYWWCVDQYGYPILGKAASKLKARRINIDCFLRFSQTASEKEDLRKYYDILRDVKISQACCDILKKEPSERIQAELKVDVIFKGLMAAESRARKTNFCTRGYLFKSSRSYIDVPFYHCNPLSIWTDDDIWEYSRRYEVPQSPLYGLTYTDADGATCTMKRNGCMGCYTDYGRKNSHMYVLRQTHPKAWKTVMTGGMASEIQKLRSDGRMRIPKSDYMRLAVLEGLENEKIAWAIEARPCAFD